jgi:hypothetical protein
MVRLLLSYFEFIATKLVTMHIGLIGNLKSASTPMYHLYLTMKECAPDQITTEAILVASGQKVIDPGAVSAFISRAESINKDIRRAFEKQAQITAVREQHGSGPRFWEH